MFKISAGRVSLLDSVFRALDEDADIFFGALFPWLLGLHIICAFKISSLPVAELDSCLPGGVLDLTTMSSSWEDPAVASSSPSFFPSALKKASRELSEFSDLAASAGFCS